MKRIFLPVVFALTLTGGLALAQSPDPAPAPAAQGHFHHKANPHREAMRMSKKLNLSADQTSEAGADPGGPGSADGCLEKQHSALA